MTNKKSTKRALLTSVLALVLCFSMLIGTTFAWFTDSVTSGNNKIVAGNLDVELEYYKDGEWATVNNATDLFTGNLWEPGHTEVVYLKLSNLGTLAVKYQLGINIAYEQTSINVYGKELKLSDYIQFGVVENKQPSYENREDAIADVTNSKPINNGYTTAGHMEADADDLYLALVVYMPEEIGNEANYKTGYEAPYIDLGINLIATQYTTEKDSFDEKYDENALYHSLPKATVTTTYVTNEEMIIVDLSNFSDYEYQTLSLDAAYIFTSQDTVNTVKLNDYAGWLADYYVSVDNDVNEGLILAGSYGAWMNGAWIGFNVPEGDHSEPVGLLGLYNGGISDWTYADVVANVKTFTCGVVDTNGSNNGSTMTVELRLINPENTEEQFVVSSIEYTFTKKVSTSEELAEALANGESVTLEAGEYETNLKIAGGSDILITGTGKDTVLSGQIASTSSTAGTITLKNLTVNVDDIVDSTGISQTGKSAIALWGNQTLICENVTFNMSADNTTAITSWWDTGVGTTIIVKNCTFNCNGQRPIRATGNVTVENCTFNDPYRYAVQLTAKTSTATEMENAIINFNNNTINGGTTSGKDVVYGIQLEGETYGCHECIINGEGNEINAAEGQTAAMYYCECGIVDHDTIVWNTEVEPVHAK